MEDQKRNRETRLRSSSGNRTTWLARAVSAALAWMGDALLGPVARAARIVADADTRLVGIGSPPFPRNPGAAASTIDHVGAIINQVRSR